MRSLFANAISFNQNLSTWNLNSLLNAEHMFKDSGIDCQNYSATLSGWADNSNTPNNINLGNASPLQYASNVVNKRDFLINTKNWTIFGDTQGSCLLSTKEITNNQEGLIYPNPATDFIYLDQIRDAKSYQILDFSGRLIKKGDLKEKMIDIRSLTKGNYILKINTEEKKISFKFIKE